MTPFEELTSLLASTITALLTAPTSVVRTEEFGALILALKIIGGIATGFLILGILYLVIKDSKITDKVDEMNKFIKADPFKDKK